MRDAKRSRLAIAVSDRLIYGPSSNPNSQEVVEFFNHTSEDILVTADDRTTLIYPLVVVQIPRPKEKELIKIESASGLKAELGREHVRRKMNTIEISGHQPIYDTPLRTYRAWIADILSKSDAIVLGPSGVAFQYREADDVGGWSPIYVDGLIAIILLIILISLLLFAVLAKHAFAKQNGVSNRG